MPSRDSHRCQLALNCLVRTAQCHLAVHRSEQFPHLGKDTAARYADKKPGQFAAEVDATSAPERITQLASACDQLPMLLCELTSWYESYSGSFWSATRTVLFIEPRSQQSLWLLFF
ncbi:hypothetical protein Q31a_25280 [Aureliella helgolandensis]|uniref:Uncharacterized protein n=1 Tax=Aureliella helgolandensis TaxID=2527968 RepID=A0A518G6J7_9BACT|nr:hypothetical protein Q31a_25280 [Aureliella helgolandensis]